MRMVQNLGTAFEKAGIDMSALKPNHFATLSVYFANHLSNDRFCARPRNGLRRWIKGLAKYIPGSAIEPEGERREHLASQCLPRHYDDSGDPQSVVELKSGQAIDVAPVTGELCHRGFAGHDAWEQHCRVMHGSAAEARTRIFYKAREAGRCPVLP